jgi:hypothetical protein
MLYFWTGMIQPFHLPVLLLTFLPQVPLYAVWTTGILLAAVRWRAHPMPSLLAIAGLGVLLAWSAGYNLAFRLLPVAVRGWELSPGVYLADLAIVSGIVNAAAWVLIVIALFAWRGEVR